MASGFGRAFYTNLAIAALLYPDTFVNLSKRYGKKSAGGIRASGWRRPTL